MNFLNRMRLWQKLAVLVLVLAVPTVLLGLFYFERVNSDVGHARDALAGIEYTKALGAMLGEVGVHRSRSREASVSPGPASKQALATSDKKLDQIVTDIDGADARYGARFNVSE